MTAEEELRQVNEILSWDVYQLDSAGWDIYNSAMTAHGRLTNSESYRRGISTAHARKPYCQWCGDTPPPRQVGNKGRLRSRLVVHHIKPIGMGGSNADGLVSLCEDCHKEAHSIDGKFCWDYVNEEMASCLRNLFAPLPIAV